MRFLTLAAVFALAGCTSMNPMTWVAPHHMEIQQGNAITEDSVARLKPGMTRAQVRFVLGSPMVADMFHADRWDYKYQLFQNGKEVKNLLFTVWFKGDVLDRFEGNALPSDKPVILDASAPAAKAP